MYRPLLDVKRKNVTLLPPVRRVVALCTRPPGPLSLRGEKESMQAATYGMNPLFTLPLYKEGMSVDSVLFYRYGFAVLILGILMKVQGQSFALKKNEVLPLIVGGLLFSASSLLLFLSYKHMDAGIASTILFVYPVMVALIMFLFFHEKVSLLTVFCILLALSGIGLLYKGEGGETLSLGKPLPEYYPRQEVKAQLASPNKNSNGLYK